VPILLSSNGRLLADPPTPAALDVVARVGAAIARVCPALHTQPGAVYAPVASHAPRAAVIRRWCAHLRQSEMP